jgi:hypothetical protein
MSRAFKRGRLGLALRWPCGRSQIQNRATYVASDRTMENAASKKRGAYRRYIRDTTAPIPRTTLWRLRKSGENSRYLINNSKFIDEVFIEYCVAELTELMISRWIIFQKLCSQDNHILLEPLNYPPNQ